MVAANDGGYIVAGAARSTNGDVIGNNGAIDSWLIKINDTGDLIWQQTYGGTKDEQAFAIDNTTDNGFILAGYSWSTDGDVLGSLNRGKNDFWIVKLSPETVGVEESSSQFSQTLNLYPNPTESFVNISVASDDAALEVSITDVLGRVVEQQNIPNGGQLSLAQLDAGLYLVAATTSNGQVFSSKIQKL
jgi:hypothetical protein